MKEIALSEVKDDLSKYLRLAEKENIVITRHGKPAGVLIGFESEDEWFDYRLEHDPRFLRRVEKARRSLRDGRGVKLEDIEAIIPVDRSDGFDMMEGDAEMNGDDYVLSDSGVKVYRTPEAHPLLKGTDTNHPDFRRKLAEIYDRGKVKGMPRILSENSEDARTWHYFSPLLKDEARKAKVLTKLLQAFPKLLSAVSPAELESAELKFWPKISPPPSCPQKEGNSEPDMLIRLGTQAVVPVEAKYKSDVSEKTCHDAKRDQVIRLLDVGSWYAREKKIRRAYVIVLQYDNAHTNAEEIVRRYAGKPDAIKQVLPYRTDLTEKDYQQLSRSVAFVHWPASDGKGKQ